MGDWLNAQVFASIVRYVLMGVGSVLAARGWLTADEASQLGGAALSLLTIVFGVISARTKHVAVDMAGGKEAVREALKPPK